MGFFSWVTSDTKKSVSNNYSSRGPLPVYLLCPDGSNLYEPRYEGYGIFKGQDVFVLVAQWNFPEKCKDEHGNLITSEAVRHLGIDIACNNKDNANLQYPIKIVERGGLTYDDVEPSNQCEYQGYFYDDEDSDDDFKKSLNTISKKQ